MLSKQWGALLIRHLSATVQAYDGLSVKDIQGILRHKNPNTTALYIQSLGVKPDKLERVFQKRSGPKILLFEPEKKAIGT
jgi:site-specific recombinase XerD